MLVFESRKQAREVVYTIRNIGNYKIYGNKEEENKILKQFYNISTQQLRELYDEAILKTSYYTHIAELDNLVACYALYSKLIIESEQVEKLAEEQLECITRGEALGMSTEEMKSILYGEYLHLLAESIRIVKIGSKYIPFIYKNINIFKHFKTLEPFIEVYRERSIYNVKYMRKM